jgi:hypothetical protein
MRERRRGEGGGGGRECSEERGGVQDQGETARWSATSGPKMCVQFKRNGIWMRVCGGAGVRAPRGGDRCGERGMRPRWEKEGKFARCAPLRCACR